MKFSRSLKLNHVFRRLYAKGSCVAGRYLVLYCKRSGTARNRVGITVSGKLGKAVDRNLVRRRLREIYRLNEARFSPGWDLVVVARTRAMDATYSKLNDAYLSLAGRLGLLTEAHDAE